MASVVECSTELGKSVRAKAGRAGTLADSDGFQEDFAKAEATYRSARALVYENVGRRQNTLDRGGRLSARQHTLIRLAVANVTWSAQEIAAFVYRLPERVPYAPEHFNASSATCTPELST